MDDFASTLNDAINSERITIAELVEATGLSRMQIYRLRNGQAIPSLKTAEIVVRELGMKLSITIK